MINRNRVNHVYQPVIWPFTNEFPYWFILNIVNYVLDWINCEAVECSVMRFMAPMPDLTQVGKPGPYWCSSTNEMKFSLISFVELHQFQFVVDHMLQIFH